MYLTIVLISVFLITPNSANSPICRSENNATVCENFEFTPQTHLNSDTNNNKLIIQNARGIISEENLSSLTTVKEIVITKSTLDDITPGALCSALPKLTAISIYRNEKFPHISKNLLKNCQNLKKLYIDDGSGLEIENGAFADLTNLHSLTMNDTMLPENVIEKETFHGLGSSLRSLTIQNSKVDTIAEDAFKNMPNLMVVDLERNGIEEIKPETFTNLPELMVLNLGNNKLKDLTWDEFKNLKALKVLFLERNDFNYVNVDKLRTYVPNLDMIFLSYDKLSPGNRKEIASTLSKNKIRVIYSNAP